jgi:CelD/BcsL family acetyltransferase involved in cellulose biosynthesis
MQIILNDDWSDRASWDAFVEAHDQGRFCHLYGYGDVVACYGGYKPVRLAFLKGRTIVAVLPATAVRSLFFGRKLVSQPFSEYGGLLIEPTLSAADADTIYALVSDYLKRHLSLRAVELHGDHGIPPQFRPGPFEPRNPHEVAVLSLDGDTDTLFQKTVQYSVRKGVNKARANGVDAFEACDLRIIHERFYPLYLKSMKRLGVPPHAIAYYIRSQEILGDRLKIFWASREKEILAGLLGFVCGSRVNIVNIVSTPESWKYAPNDLIHWAFIKWAAECGFKYFDFGSVRYEGQRTYKKKWGATFAPHGYHLLSREAAKKPATFSSSAPALVSLSKMWSEYVPERLAQFAGPFIRQQLVR